MPGLTCLVVAASQISAHRQQFELRVSGHQAFGRVEHFDGVRAVSGGHRHPDTRPSVELMRPRFGGR
ncbi:MAG: hypothetical protein QOI30_3446, partial [Mycobacterium sp.]|nr:hypothetical protein [Mycobacterium sp.]